MNDDDINMARNLLHTVVDFIENGKLDSLVEDEIVNYFRMCHQVEFYYEKFALKGFYIRVDHETGSFSLNVTPGKSPNGYDLRRLADKFLLLFCRQSVPAVLIKRAIRSYKHEFGDDRFKQFSQDYANLKKGYSLARVCSQVGDDIFLLDGAHFIESYMTIAAKHNGIHRVNMLLKELIAEDACAELVVSIMANEYDMDQAMLFEIKTMLLNHLAKKYKEVPSDRLWTMVLKCPYLTSAVNSFEPFLDLILEIVKDVAGTLQVQPAPADYGLRIDRFEFEDLVSLMIRLYRNPNSMQKSMLFMFDMFQSNASVWSNIISACHNKPAIEDNRANFPFGYKV